MSKIRRMDACPDLRALAQKELQKEIECETLQHPRKAPQAQALASTPAMTNLLEEMDTQPLSQVPAKDSPPSTTPKKNEPVSLDDVLKKLRKDSGYNFIPLSSGKYLSNVWWEIIDCQVSDARYSTGMPMLLLTTKIFLDVAGETPKMDEIFMETKFRCSAEEILHICYLKDRVMRELHSERTYSYEEWSRRMLQICRFSDCECDSDFANRVFKYVQKQVITRIPKRFRILFCKRPHNTIIGMPENKVETNMNSMLCEAKGKNVFYYEFKANIFIISEKETCKFDEEEMTIASEETRF